MLRRVAVVRSSRALRGDAIVIVIVLALRADGPLAAAGARRLQAAAVLAGLLLHARAAKLGLVPAIWAAAAVGSPAALTGAAPQHAVDLDDCALARRAWRAVVDGGRRVVRLLRLVRGREDRELAVRQGQRRRAALRALASSPPPESIKSSAAASSICAVPPAVVAISGDASICSLHDKSCSMVAARSGPPRGRSIGLPR